MNVDEKSWQLFFNLHWPLFYSVAMGSGLSLEEAQDVVQETILSAVKGVGQLKARQKLGRRWLLGIIRSHTVRMLPHRRGFLPSLDEQLAHPLAPDWEPLWLGQWDQKVLEAAIKEVRPRMSQLEFEIFDLHVVKHWPAKKVAERLGVTTKSVHRAKREVNGMIRSLLEPVRKMGF